MKVLKCVSLFFVFGVFASCSQLIDSVEGKADGGAGRVVVELGAQNPNRTALPSEQKDGYKDFRDIVLYGSKSGAMTQLAAWETYAKIASDETAIIVADGSWNFRLTAKRYGVLFSQDLSGVTVRSGSPTKLQFTNMRIDSENTGTKGAIEAKINISGEVFPSGYSVFVNAKLDDGEESEKQFEYSSSFFYSYTYLAEDVEQGNHVVTFFVYKAEYDSEIGQTVARDLLLVLPFYANVIPGYKSTIEEYFHYASTVSGSSSVAKHSVTYKANYPSGTADDFVQEYFDGCSILDARGIGFAYSTGGKRFAYWTTDAAGNGTKYYAGDAPQFSADVTLYAQWKTFSDVVYCLNPLDSKVENESYAQQYDAQSSIIAIATANFSQKMTGYVFCGWDTKPNGTGTRYAPNTKPTIQEDTMLYAQWCHTYAYGVGYEISSARELYALFKAPTSLVDAFSATIHLDSGFSGASITTLTRAREFSGTFNGKGATLSGITQPLFTTVSGSVSGVNIASSTINGSGAIAETCAAGGNIFSCSVASTVSVTGKSSDLFVGGIVGTNNGTVSSCKMNGSVTSSTYGVYVGGIVGKNAGTVSSPTVTGASVTASGNAFGAAGVAGYNTNSVTDATVSQSKITGGGYAYVNEIAIGLSGTATTESATDNTLSGKSNVAYATTSYEHSASSTGFYYFEAAHRTTSVRVRMKITNGYTWPSLYKGEYVPPATVPTPLLSVTTRLNDNDTLDKTVSIESSASEYKHTFTIKNDNTFQKATGTFSIEME